MRFHLRHLIPRFSTIVSLSLGFWMAGETIPTQVAQTAATASIGTAVTFKCSDSEATIRAKKGPKVTFGNSTIYIGYQQVSSVNKNPLLIRFNNGVRAWCKSNYEVTGDDSTGYGLIWDGSSVLYGVFSATGTQGTSSQDFRRFATNGWLKGYGSGGGPKIAILARINPSTGNVASATFLSAVRRNGKSNSVTVTGLSWTGTNLVVRANSWFSPRRTNRRAMSCSGSAPFSYRIEFSSNLSSAVKASAARCS